MRGDDMKYTVFKAESPTAFSSMRDPKPLDPDTYFVIRSSDLFGSAALWGYAHLVQTGIEIARQRPGTFTDEECTRLSALAEVLSKKAEEWAVQGGRKVPD